MNNLYYAESVNGSITKCYQITEDALSGKASIDINNYGFHIVMSAYTTSSTLREFINYYINMNYITSKYLTKTFGDHKILMFNEYRNQTLTHIRNEKLLILLDNE